MSEYPGKYGSKKSVFWGSLVKLQACTVQCY